MRTLNNRTNSRLGYYRIRNQGNCDCRLVSVFSAETISSDKMSIDISESINQLMVERQGPDDFTRFQTRESCAWEIAAYVFKSCNLPQTRSNSDIK